MKTSAFSLYCGPGRISIARYAPRITPAGYRIYKPLAPLPDMLRLMDQAAYRDRYFGEVLAPLDPRATWDALHQLAGGAEPVLLCWEQLKMPGEFCHRRLVAEWLGGHLGEQVDEWEPSGQLALAL